MRTKKLDPTVTNFQVQWNPQRLQLGDSRVTTREITAYIPEEIQRNISEKLRELLNLYKKLDTEHPHSGTYPWSGKKRQYHIALGSLSTEFNLIRFFHHDKIPCATIFYSPFTGEFHYSDSIETSRVRKAIERLTDPKFARLGLDVTRHVNPMLDILDYLDAVSQAKKKAFYSVVDRFKPTFEERNKSIEMIQESEKRRALEEEIRSEKTTNSQEKEQQGCPKYCKCQNCLQIKEMERQRDQLAHGNVWDY